ncbi:ATP-binding protein [Saccharicrinis sp. FJH54]|uniref:sensor histidine kinase n=1 Tax=Saccharicrinis sp. FJH54 TaxID=3344665 RepID=UPI0035D3DC40
MLQRIKTKFIRPLFESYIKIRSSIYGRVILIIVFSSLILFLSFSLIFRAVYGEYLRTVIRQNGNNVGSIVEGALYTSMLENDKTELQNTLDLINTMSGIDEVNMYNSDNQLIYTSFSSDDHKHSDPDCIKCHGNLSEMFPPAEKAYRIIDMKSGCTMTDNDNNHRHLMIRSPILNQPSCYTASCHAHGPDEKVLGSLIIKAPLDDLDKAVMKSSTDFFAMALVTTFLLITILVFFTGKNIRKPLNELTRASEAVANGDNSIRLTLKPNQLGDIHMVSSAFNNMLDKLQAANTELENWSKQLEYKVQKKSEELSAAQNEMIHIERIASLGKLSASVAHELNNPLSGMLVYTKLVSRQLRKEDFSTEKRQSLLKHLQFVENEIVRCGDIVKGLLDFSRKDQDNFAGKHLHHILKETTNIVLHSIKIANIRLITNYEATEDLISCNAAQLKQAFIAILVNATEAITDSGEIVMETRNEDDHSIRLEISDNGSGISEDNLKHVFEPFFSTKHQTSGIGLGLAIVHGIIQNHNGEIGITSTVGKGTRVSIKFSLMNQ